MTKNLESADHIVRLTLAVLVILFYFTDLIHGSSALILAILAGLIIGSFLVRTMLKWMTMD